jgi:hypothetical protein
MPSNIEQFIEEIVEASKLSLVKKNQLRKELYCDFFDKQRELHLQGFDEQKSLTMIKQRFGNTEIISKELRMIHSQLTAKYFILRGVILWCFSVVVLTFLDQFMSCQEVGMGECVVGLTILSFFSPALSLIFILVAFLNEFSLIFIGINVLAITLVYCTMRLFKKYFSNTAARKRVVALIFSGALILNWLSIFASKQFVPYASESFALEHYLPQSTAGFPLKVFDYPFSPMGNDHVPLYMWKNFYINFAIWFLVSIILYFFIPRKIKDSNHTVFNIAVVACISTFYSLGLILLWFD